MITVGSVSIDLSGIINATATLVAAVAAALIATKRKQRASRIDSTENEGTTL